MKKCSKCGEEKSYSEYSKADKYKDGYSCWCKDCHKINAADKYVKKVRKPRKEVSREELNAKARARYAALSATEKSKRNRKKNKKVSKAYHEAKKKALRDKRDAYRARLKEEEAARKLLINRLHDR